MQNPFIIFGENFQSKIALAYTKLNQSLSLSTSGKKRNLFFYHTGISSGNFKANQRKERKLSRKRKTKR